MNKITLTGIWFCGFTIFGPNTETSSKKLLKLSSMLSGAGYFPKCLFSWSFSPPHSSPHGQTAQGQTTPTAFFLCLISHHIEPQYLGTICILINIVRIIKLPFSHPYCDKHSGSYQSFSIVTGLQVPPCQVSLLYSDLEPSVPYWKWYILIKW